MHQSELIQVRVDTELRRRLTRLRTEHHVNLSAWLRSLIARELDRETGSGAPAFRLATPSLGGWELGGDLSRGPWRTLSGVGRDPDHRSAEKRNRLEDESEGAGGTPARSRGRPPRGPAAGDRTCLVNSGHSAGSPTIFGGSGTGSMTLLVRSWSLLPRCAFWRTSGRSSSLSLSRYCSGSSSNFLFPPLLKAAGLGLVLLLRCGTEWVFDDEHRQRRG